jgi:HEAT repeat protein
LVLYILARDNEDGRIKEEIARRPSFLLALSRRALHSTEADARWQLADALGFVDAADAEVEPLLVQFYNDSDEYVSRRALLAIGNRRSDKAEALALRSWDTGLEYQQIAALHVLSHIGSAQFEVFRQMAERDPRQYLANAAMTHAVPERRSSPPLPKGLRLKNE